MPFTPPPPSGASGGIKSTGSSMLRQRPSQIPRLTSDVDARHRAAAEAAASIIVKQQAAAAFPGKWEFPQHIEREPHDVEQWKKMNAAQKQAFVKHNSEIYLEMIPGSKSELAAPHGWRHPDNHNWVYVCPTHPKSISFQDGIYKYRDHGSEPATYHYSSMPPQAYVPR